MARSTRSSRGYGEGLFSAVSAGVFFVLVGAIFVYTFAVLDVNLFSEIVAFAQGFGLVSVPNTPIVRFPAPRFPSAHLPIYVAAGQFSLFWGIYQVAILAVRFVARSPVTRKAETASNVIYWFGASYLLSLFLTETVTRSAWFEFWAAILILVGVSMVVRAIILAVARLL